MSGRTIIRGFCSLMLLCGLSLPALAQDDAVKGERVSGPYKIVSIEKPAPGQFTVQFEAQKKDGVHDQLVLRTEGDGLRLTEGQTLQLSAEVLRSSAKQQEITQALLFLPSKDYGYTPLWFLSKDHPNQSIRGARWLEMHAPQADYMVF